MLFLAVKNLVQEKTRLLISVGEGVVTLSGEVDDHIERDRLLGLVREVSSVREVRDQLTVRGAASPLN